jgi:hypothetical protein
VTFALPPITSARDAADVMSGVMSAVAAGQITPADAVDFQGGCPWRKKAKLLASQSQDGLSIVF